MTRMVTVIVPRSSRQTGGWASNRSENGAKSKRNVKGTGEATGVTNEAKSGSD
jgi:hypothetical protein